MGVMGPAEDLREIVARGTGVVLHTEREANVLRIRGARHRELGLTRREGRREARKAAVVDRAVPLELCNADRVVPSFAYRGGDQGAYQGLEGGASIDLDKHLKRRAKNVERRTADAIAPTGRRAGNRCHWP